MVVILGLGSVWGALFGAAAVTVLVQVLTQVGTRPGMPGYMPDLLSYAAYGVALVLIMAFVPAGILPGLSGLKAEAARRLGMRPPGGAARRPDAAVPTQEPAGRASDTSP